MAMALIVWDAACMLLITQVTQVTMAEAQALEEAAGLAKAIPVAVCRSVNVVSAHRLTADCFTRPFSCSVSAALPARPRADMMAVLE
jgi:hypothetical protein